MTVLADPDMVVALLLRVLLGIRIVNIIVAKIGIYKLDNGSHNTAVLVNFVYVVEITNMPAGIIQF